MSTLEKAEDLRKKLKTIQARISKAANEKIAATRELDAIEALCRHQWSKPQLQKGSDTIWSKDCAFCGKVLTTTKVEVKF